MPVPAKIWLELVNEWRGLMGLREMPESEEYREPGAKRRRAKIVSNMITMVIVWSKFGAFLSESDMGEKFIRHANDQGYQPPNRQQMRAAYAELRRRWPHEYEAGYDDIRLIGV